EIEFLGNYVEISKSRFDTDYKIGFVVKKTGNPLIAPFLLLPLVENAFKHVSQYPDKQNKIHISIAYNETELDCLIRNTAENVKVNNGIGLKNLKRRLELLYKDKYTFFTRYEDGLYQSRLKIIL
ncbi:MAG: sensor histidine kinase, partial [Flavisolibacter sp.]|nr:sensor histidine kinase [Flavisolibacter sp.]